MKTKHLILSLITSLFVATIPLKAQKNEQINYYKNHPELGGDVIITKLVKNTPRR